MASGKPTAVRDKFIRQLRKVGFLFVEFLFVQQLGFVVYVTAFVVVGAEFVEIFGACVSFFNKTRWRTVMCSIDSTVKGCFRFGCFFSVSSLFFFFFRDYVCVRPRSRRRFPLRSGVADRQGRTGILSQRINTCCSSSWPAAVACCSSRRSRAQDKRKGTADHARLPAAARRD